MAPPHLFLEEVSLWMRKRRRSHLRTLMCRPQLASLATREQAAQAPLALVPTRSPRSLAVRSMDRFMLENARIQAEMNVMFQRHLENKQQVAY